MSEETYMGVPRKKILWYPKIDWDKCNLCDGDPQCLKFCPHGVYAISDESKRLVVKNPNNCVVFCRSCRRMCAPDALSFPSKKEVLEFIKKLRRY